MGPRTSKTAQKSKTALKTVNAKRKEVSPVSVPALAFLGSASRSAAGAALRSPPVARDAKVTIKPPSFAPPSSAMDRKVVEPKQPHVPKLAAAVPHKKPNTSILPSHGRSSLKLSDHVTFLQMKRKMDQSGGKKECCLFNAIAMYCLPRVFIIYIFFV